MKERKKNANRLHEHSTGFSLESYEKARISEGPGISFMVKSTLSGGQRDAHGSEVVQLAPHQQVSTNVQGGGVLQPCLSSQKSDIHSLWTPVKRHPLHRP